MGPILVVVGLRGECERGSTSLLGGIRGADDFAGSDKVAFCAGCCTSDGSFNVDSVVPIVSYFAFSS